MDTFDFLKPLENVTPRFTEEQMSEIVNWFDENSKPLLIINENPEPVNVVTVEQLITFLGLRKFHRRSFYAPSYADIMKEVEALKMGTQRMLIKDQFIYILDKWVMEPDMKHELKLAFKVFDTEERDFLEEDNLKELLVTYGEVPLDNNEVVEFIRDANVKGDGNIFYNAFVDSIFNLAPELYEIPKEYLYEDPDEDPSVPPLPPEPEPEPIPEAPPLPPVEAPPSPATGKSAAAAKGADKKKKK